MLTEIRIQLSCSPNDEEKLNLARKCDRFPRFRQHVANRWNTPGNEDATTPAVSNEALDGVAGDKRHGSEKKAKIFS